MTDEHLARRLEKALGEDERTHELGIRIHLVGDRIVAEGEVASQERRRAVLEVIREREPGVAVTDQLTVSADSIQRPAGREPIQHG